MMQLHVDSEAFHTLYFREHLSDDWSHFDFWVQKRL